MASATGSARAARFKAKMKQYGYVQANVWVPAKRLDEFRTFATVLRLHPDAEIVASITVSKDTCSK